MFSVSHGKEQLLDISPSLWLCWSPQVQKDCNSMSKRTANISQVFNIFFSCFLYLRYVNKFMQSWLDAKCLLLLHNCGLPFLRVGCDFRGLLDWTDCQPCRVIFIHFLCTDTAFRTLRPLLVCRVHFVNDYWPPAKLHFFLFFEFTSQVLTDLSFKNFVILFQAFPSGLPFLWCPISMALKPDYFTLLLFQSHCIGVMHHVWSFIRVCSISVNLNSFKRSWSKIQKFEKTSPFSSKDEMVKFENPLKPHRSLWWMKSVNWNTNSYRD